MPKLSGKETKMKRVFVDTIHVGADDAKHYGVDAKGVVYLIDIDGESHEVSETVAKEVRELTRLGDCLPLPDRLRRYTRSW